MRYLRQMFSARSMSRIALAARIALILATLCGASIAAAQDVIPNPEFDLPSVAGWVGDDAGLFWAQDDPECSPPNASGSLAITPLVPNSPASAVLCVAAPGPSPLNFTAQLILECQSRVDAFLDFFPDALCGGASLQTSTAGATVPSGSWLELAVQAMNVPVGTQSIGIQMKVSESVSAGCGARFDQFYLGSGALILRAGFETGSSTCHWVTVP
ncbi:MAG: hypothetical protein ABI689_17900 [Thermoanaerobaculia bacterium]